MHPSFKGKTVTEWDSTGCAHQAGIELADSRFRDQRGQQQYHFGAYRQTRIPGSQVVTRIYDPWG
jgi:hypothetical protein